MCSTGIPLRNRFLGSYKSNGLRGLLITCVHYSLVKHKKEIRYCNGSQVITQLE